MPDIRIMPVFYGTAVLMSRLVLLFAVDSNHFSYLFGLILLLATVDLAL